MSEYLYGANVHANGIRQHYLRYGGKGPAVVIVPGITSPAVTWGFVAERFGRHFDTYVLDVRGRGLSEASDTLDYGLDAQADDVAAFAKALGLRQYMVVGHSMGGRIAVRLARRHPGAGFDRLALIDPPVSGPGRRPYPSALPWYVDSIRAALEGMDADAMREFCPTWSEEQLRLRAEWLHTCDERAVVKSYDDMHQEDIHQDMPHIQVPVLLMAAGRGDVISDADVEEIETLIPELRVTRVTSAGHMIPWDDEDAFYRAFGDFLGTPL
ncbi:MAG: alpha/beta hydrolase [Alcanivorax sp.]|uniref:alpha/beta fold hydrolase n=1 Tax=Alloalcanivorax marinus TaxID=1177169 RepID=UPI00195C44C7|nr:alpha/beta hydrolase [Alloalcanivorax marinus]MBM7333929.1 alpha/beta hydrolase [Alloalcanivorax marinus]